MKRKAADMTNVEPVMQTCWEIARTDPWHCADTCKQMGMDPSMCRNPANSRDSTTFMQQEVVMDAQANNSDGTLEFTINPMLEGLIFVASGNVGGAGADEFVEHPDMDTYRKQYSEYRMTSMGISIQMTQSDMFNQGQGVIAPEPAYDFPQDLSFDSVKNLPKSVAGAAKDGLSGVLTPNGICARVGNSVGPVPPATTGINLWYDCSYDNEQWQDLYARPDQPLGSDRIEVSVTPHTVYPDDLMDRVAVAFSGLNHGGTPAQPANFVVRLVLNFEMASLNKWVAGIKRGITASPLAASDNGAVQVANAVSKVKAAAAIGIPIAKMAAEYAWEFGPEIIEAVGAMIAL